IEEGEQEIAKVNDQSNNHEAISSQKQREINAVMEEQTQVVQAQSALREEIANIKKDSKSKANLRQHHENSKKSINENIRKSEKQRSYGIPDSSCAGTKRT